MYSRQDENDENTTDMEPNLSSREEGDSDLESGFAGAENAHDLLFGYDEEENDERENQCFVAASSDPNLCAELEHGVFKPNQEWVRSNASKADLMAARIPSYLPLNSPLLVPLSMSADQLISLCDKRTSCLDSGNEIFIEEVEPFELPETPRQSSSNRQVVMDIPVVNVTSRDMAFSNDLKTLCESSALILMRSMTTCLSMDLSTLSTESMLEFPTHDVELRLQLMPSTSEFNCDAYGRQTWRYQSIPSKTTLAKYAEYQMQCYRKRVKSFVYGSPLLKSMSSEGSLTDTECRTGGKMTTERRSTPGRIKRAQTIKFGTNVDLADKKKFRRQLTELSKLPPFLRIEDSGNMLSYLGYDIAGVNTVQFYMKVKGVRTPGHLENNCLASVNINIGPDDCEWFGVDYSYLSAINKMVERNKLKFLHDSWWPNYHELLEAGIPVYRFLQKCGDVVWVGSGCIHWVESSGVCNNVAWNVAPLTPKQYSGIVSSYQWNINQNYMSVVPLQHLSWQLAQNLDIADPQLYILVRRMLIRSLAYSRIIANVVGAYREIRRHPHYRGDAALFCVRCEIEVWNIFFVKSNSGKYDVHCFNCARKEGLKDFIILQQYNFDELSTILDKFVLKKQYVL